MYCIFCGAVLTAEALYCSDCGAPANNAIRETGIADNEPIDFVNKFVGREGSQLDIRSPFTGAKRPVRSIIKWLAIGFGIFLLLATILGTVFPGHSSGGSGADSYPSPLGNQQAYDAGWNSVADLTGPIGGFPLTPDAQLNEDPIKGCIDAWDKSWDEGDYVQGCVDAQAAWDSATNGGSNPNATIAHK